ncbi:hypothetical protein BD324DRAFT_647447 [Kockovaella imperatae]|uniref:Anaphase-promoting complex subunit 4 n=1 Tax=Kockovaella imperatae TaxID=4999 RepID=A0A1Y1UR46_9TREE|nr:hypothetical protein BD324DRAFT_647447 [Kockovaella imperatae]ORX40520.1 hypothetical protein BD324DRAFT_647447 [Kockovaella imperatae]
MDLVILLSSPDTHGKGKERAGGILVELWRLSGGKVWDREIQGRLGGLAWTLDGLHLSLLLLHGRDCTVDHLSVHDGKTVRSIPLDIHPSDSEWLSYENGNRWWHMGWEAGKSPWPQRGPGEPLTIFDSLPRVSIPEQPKPPHLMMMRLKQAPDDTSPAPRHELLKDFPCLLPSASPMPPDILRIGPPASDIRHLFLTGTYPTDVRTDLRQVLLVDKISEMLDVVLRGISVAHHHFREAGKQTMIWREEVETCGEQQGMSKKDTHSDLFRLLMTGRCSPGVSEWLGNRLTGRTLTKWEETMTNGYKAIQTVISESITPALERIVLLTPHRATLPITLGLCKLIEGVRQTAAHEAMASAEFIKWLNYEIARGVSQDQSSDAQPSITYDLKLVWSFLKAGFIDSPLQQHFHSLDKDDYVTIPSRPKAKPLPLDTVLRRTVHRLNGAHVSTPVRELSPVNAHLSLDSSAISHDDDDEDDADSSPDSPDTVAVEHPVEDYRNVMLEPWAWANTLLKQCRSMVSYPEPEHEGGYEDLGKEVYAEADFDGLDGQKLRAWVNVGTTRRLTVSWLNPWDRPRQATFEADGEIIALHFFDEDELAVLLVCDGQTYLATVNIERNIAEDVPLQISRCRQIDGIASGRNSLATNGRKGRRSGCVLTTGGRRLEVFDMDQDEDGDEEGDEEQVDEDEEMDE